MYSVAICLDLCRDLNILVYTDRNHASFVQTFFFKTRIGVKVFVFKHATLRIFIKKMT